jgi:phospho-N-acetylmuramoyl-pentapeptide-transferase
MTIHSELMLTFLTALPAALLLTVLLCRHIIPVLRNKKVGQHVFSEYVAEHQSKEGTPTMGGVCFILPILLLLLPYVILKAIDGEAERLIPLAMTVCLGVANALIGFFDDIQKLSHNQNLGLKSWQKFLLQVAVAALYLWGMSAFGGMTSVLTLNTFNVSIDLGIGYYVIALVVIVGMVNSTNLTDGIDGLASTVALVANMCLSLLAFFSMDGEAVLIGGLTVGAMIGFLVFNYHPAKVFMGDTGSLFLGGAVGALGIVTAHPLLMLLACGVFVAETASVVLQVLFFKVTGGKRLFLMAPLHHHLEKRGWSEWQIVLVFCAWGALFGALALMGR